MRGVWKYIVVFLLTCGVFAISWYVSAYFNQKKIAEISTIQNKIAIDLLSTETQFDLVENLSCQDIDSSFLSAEIGDLASKISFSIEQNIADKDQLNDLKKQYSLLEAKDFLLSNRIAARCGKKIATILYFYGDKDSCPDCVRQGYVLDTIRDQYPLVRVYSFDFGLDLSTIKAFEAIYKINDNLPALVINGKTMNGFKSLDDLTALLPKSVTAPPVPPKTTTPTTQKSPTTN
ncbi:MAG TPA: hypothetical protein VG982_01640 [Candidatus Paceibacterota bacterium]|nr:hypothetical protein [Candidatus Paceibacterota bacterium]